jgi:SAM-dependent methyltransferase
MHAAARSFVAGALAGSHFGAVVEIGGRDINGGVRDLFTCDTYVSLDLEPGAGVDVVTDCRDWTPPEPVDLVICCEVLEHAPDPAGVVKAAVSYLAPGGLLVVTAAGPGRAAHSGHDGGPVRPGEHYGNIDPDDLDQWLAELDDVQVVYAPMPCDVYATGMRR